MGAEPRASLHRLANAARACVLGPFLGAPRGVRVGPPPRGPCLALLLSLARAHHRNSRGPAPARGGDPRWPSLRTPHLARHEGRLLRLRLLLPGGPGCARPLGLSTPLCKVGTGVFCGDRERPCHLNSGSQLGDLRWRICPAAAGAWKPRGKGEPPLLSSPEGLRRGQGAGAESSRSAGRRAPGRR